MHCTSYAAMKKGMNLEEMTVLARCNGLHTMTHRPAMNENDPKFVLLNRDMIVHEH